LRSLGRPDSVARLTRDHLVAFRDRHLCGKNGVLAVFGAVKAQEIRAMVEREFEALPAGAAIEPIEPLLPPLAARKVEELRPKQQAVIMAGFRTGGLRCTDRAALEIIDEACSDLGSRLFLRIREEMGLAYFVGTSQFLGTTRGAFTFYLGTDPNQRVPVMAALHDEICKLAEEGLTTEELARAKAKIIGQQDIRHQSNDAFAFSCALDELYGLGFDHHAAWRQEIDAVSLEDIRRVAGTYFSEDLGLTAIARPA